MHQLPRPYLRCGDVLQTCRVSKRPGGRRWCPGWKWCSAKPAAARPSAESGTHEDDPDEIPYLQEIFDVPTEFSAKNNWSGTLRWEGVREMLIVPHGAAVMLNPPAVLLFTAPANPQRHLEAAAAIGADMSHVGPKDADEMLADAVTGFMRDLDVPNGLQALGYTEADIPVLVEGTLPQHRVTKLSPRPFSNDDLTGMFRDALRAW